MFLKVMWEGTPVLITKIYVVTYASKIEIKLAYKPFKQQGITTALLLARLLLTL